MGSELRPTIVTSWQTQIQGVETQQCHVLSFLVISHHVYGESFQRVRWDKTMKKTIEIDRDCGTAVRV